MNSMFAELRTYFAIIVRATHTRARAHIHTTATAVATTTYTNKHTNTPNIAKKHARTQTKPLPPRKRVCSLLAHTRTLTDTPSNITTHSHSHTRTHTHLQTVEEGAVAATVAKCPRLLVEVVVLSGVAGDVVWTVVVVSATCVCRVVDAWGTHGEVAMS